MKSLSWDLTVFIPSTKQSVSLCLWADTETDVTQRVLREYAHVVGGVQVVACRCVGGKHSGNTTPAPKASTRPRPVQTAIVQAFLGQWRRHADVGDELGQTTKWVSKALGRTRVEGVYLVEKRIGPNGLEHRIMARES